MFERFNEAARRALFWSRYEATQFGTPAIDTEHLMLGLLHDGKDGHGIVQRLLTRAQVPVDRVREATVARLGARSGEKLAQTVEIPFTGDSKRALQYGAQEADGLGHAHIGREHLLLGLLRGEGSAAHAVLIAHGLRLWDLRTDVAAILAETTDLDADEAAGRDDIFSARS